MTENNQQQLGKPLWSIAASLDALIDTVSGKRDSLRDHKKGLMQQLLPSPEGE